MSGANYLQQKREQDKKLAEVKPVEKTEVKEEVKEIVKPEVVIEPTEEDGE